MADEIVPGWRREMMEEMGRILNGFNPRDYPNARLAQHQYTMALGDLEIRTLDRLDDLDGERRGAFLEDWIDFRRSQIQRDASAAVAKESDAERQVEAHEPYLQELRKLGDATVRNFEQDPEFESARLAMEAKLAERREAVHKRFMVTEQALDARFGLRIAGRDTQAETFLANIAKKQQRERDDERER